MKKLHVCAVMSDSYFEIYQKAFNKTLPREFTSVNILHIRDYNSEPGKVAEHNFKVINYKKLEFIAQQLILHQGDNLLVMDLDVVCFRNFKDEINMLLEDNDMVFQQNPHYTHAPYCVGVWGLQCNQQNIYFFGREIMPRAEALLITKSQWAHVALAPHTADPMWFSRAAQLRGQNGIYDGDQCVVNTALLESEFGKQMKVGMLPDTYSQDAEGGVSPQDCVLYHATACQGAVEKITHLTNTYNKILAAIQAAESNK